MNIAAKLRRAPGRIASGAYLLNSGLGKFGADADTAKRVHAMAVSAYPVFDRIPAPIFVKALGAGETVLGGALLAPFLKARTAGLGLTAFAGGLLAMYWRTPGVHHEGSPRPTAQGTALAKDSWLFAIGASLVIDDVTTGSRRKS